MKRYLLLITLSLFALASFAQDKQERQELRRQYREGELLYIQQAAILSDAEFAEFKTIYNQYRDARKRVRQANKQVKPAEGAVLTEEQATANIEARINKEIEFAELYKEYIGKLQAKFSNTKICKIEAAQKEYKKLKFKELQGVK